MHEEIIWLHFVDKIPPGYDFDNTNLQSSKKPLTRTVPEDALRGESNVESGQKKGKVVSDTVLFVSNGKGGGGKWSRRNPGRNVR